MVSCFNSGLNTHYVILKISHTKNIGSKRTVVLVFVHFRVPKLFACFWYSGGVEFASVNW